MVLELLELEERAHWLEKDLEQLHRPTIHFVSDLAKPLTPFADPGDTGASQGEC